MMREKTSNDSTRMEALKRRNVAVRAEVYAAMRAIASGAVAVERDAALTGNTGGVRWRPVGSHGRRRTAGRISGNTRLVFGAIGGQFGQRDLAFHGSATGVDCPLNRQVSRHGNVDPRLNSTDVPATAEDVQ